MSGRRRHDWTCWHALGLIGLVSAGVLATHEAWVDLWHIAGQDEEASHLFLVPLVAGALVWVRRARLRHCRPEATGLGPVLVAGGWLLYVLGDRLLLQAPWHLGAVLVALGCAVSILGADAVRRFVPAFAALIFLVPVPGLLREQMARPLETVAARSAAGLLELLGSPVVRSGNVLSVGGIDLTIAEACNGLRMVFALTLVAYAFAFATPLRNYVRGLILLASPVLALAVNIGRLSATVWVYGHCTHPTADLFHDVAGWLMLPLAFVLLMGIIQALRWALLPVTVYTLAYD